MGEAEREESFEVHCSASVGPAEPVGVDASVAEPPAVVLDEPGDGPFDHPAVLAVGVIEVVDVGLGCPDKLVGVVDER